MFLTEFLIDFESKLNTAMTIDQVPAKLQEKSGQISNQV
jgi:hypothetical protein